MHAVLPWNTRTCVCVPGPQAAALKRSQHSQRTSDLGLPLGFLKAQGTEAPASSLPFTLITDTQITNEKYLVPLHFPTLCPSQNSMAIFLAGSEEPKETWKFPVQFLSSQKRMRGLRKFQSGSSPTGREEAVRSQIWAGIQKRQETLNTHSSVQTGKCSEEQECGGPRTSQSLQVWAGFPEVTLRTSTEVTKWMQGSAVLGQGWEPREVEGRGRWPSRPRVGATEYSYRHSHNGSKGENLENSILSSISISKSALLTGKKFPLGNFRN